MFLESCHLLHIARQALDRIPQDSDQTLVTVVFAAISIEAFFNELQHLSSPDGLLPEEPEVVARLHGKLNEADELRQSLSDRYLLSYAVLANNDLEKGADLYQQFDCLMKFRNALVHHRSQKFFGITPEQSQEGVRVGSLESPPKFIRQLETLRLITMPQGNVMQSWISIVQTQPVGRWALETAASTIESVLSVAPADSRFAEYRLNAYGEAYVAKARS